MSSRYFIQGSNVQTRLHIDSFPKTYIRDGSFFIFMLCKLLTDKLETIGLNNTLDRYCLFKEFFQFDEMNVKWMIVQVLTAGVLVKVSNILN